MPRIVDIKSIGPRTRLVSLDMRSLAFSHAAGQAVFARTDDTEIPLAYSIACSPTRLRQTGHLELVVADCATRVAGLTNARHGRDVHVTAPRGGFDDPAPYPECRSLVFVAGGSGIAPFRAMVQEAVCRPSPRRLSLLFSARTVEELLFADEFRHYARLGRISLSMAVTREQSTAAAVCHGRIDHARLEAMITIPSQTACFVCGPPAMVADISSMLGSIGVPDGQIHIDRLIRAQ
jgi:ferredoxin-NADP reductase